MEAIKIKEKIPDKIPDKHHYPLKSPIMAALAFLSGFMLSNPFILGTFSPFSISLTASCNDKNHIFAGIGSLFGALFFYDDSQAAKYIASTLLCVLINVVCRKYPVERLRDISKCCNAFLSSIVISLAISAATGFNAEDLIMIVSEAIICAAGCYVFDYSFKTIRDTDDLSHLKTKDFVCILIACGLLIMPLTGYSVMYFSPATIILMYIVIFSALLKGFNGSAISGICMGTLLGLSGETGYINIGIAFAGIICGMLCSKKRIYMLIGFLVPISLAANFDGTLEAYSVILESLTACILIMLTPKKLLAFINSRLNVPSEKPIKSPVTTEICRRISDIADTFYDISNCVDKVQKTLEPVTALPLTEILKSGWYKTCYDCEIKDSCNINPEKKYIEKIAQVLSDDLPFDAAAFPDNFETACYKYDEMKSELYNRYLRYCANFGVKGKLSQIQALVTTQFKSIADMLKDISVDFEGGTFTSVQAAELCAQRASEFGLNVVGSVCKIDKLGRKSIILNITPPEENFNVSELTDILSCVIGVPLDIPDLITEENLCTLTFFQQISININIGGFSCPAKERTVCGDYFRCFHDTQKCSVTVLSDGMGTGIRAAVDSAMASELFSKLLKTGLSIDCAIPIVNSAMLVKSDDESLATLDVAYIDPYTCNAEFIKAGAAATFICRKGSVAVLEQASLPLGILHDISVTHASAKLKPGDIILVVSDGTLGDSNVWIQQELKNWDGDNPTELSKYIVSCAGERNLGKPRDDMTVVTIMIH